MPFFSRGSDKIQRELTEKQKMPLLMAATGLEIAHSAASSAALGTKIPPSFFSS